MWLRRRGVWGLWLCRRFGDEDGEGVEEFFYMPMRRGEVGGDGARIFLRWMRGNEGRIGGLWT